jgi:hypothetical protein
MSCCGTVHRQVNTDNQNALQLAEMGEMCACVRVYVCARVRVYVCTCQMGEIRRDARHLVVELLLCCDR